MQIKLFLIFTLTAIAIFANAQEVKDNAQYVQLLRTHLPAGNDQIVGMAALLKSSAVEIISTAGSNASWTGDTQFEIGGMTRIFTVLLLADLATDRIVKLDDPVNHYLDKQDRLQKKRDGKEVTLLDLALNTSGLPFEPPTLLGDSIPTYVDFRRSDMIGFAHNWKPKNERVWIPSNVGYAVLSFALAKRARQPYDSLLKKRILNRLGMKNTVAYQSKKQRDRMHQGYGKNLKQAPLWMCPGLQGAMEIKTTIKDMVILLKQLSDPTEAHFKKMTDLIFSNKIENLAISQAMGFMLTEGRNGNEIAYAGGQTWGFNSFMAIDRKNRFAVMLLCNYGDFLKGVGWNLFRELEK